MRQNFERLIHCNAGKVKELWRRLAECHEEKQAMQDLLEEQMRCQAEAYREREGILRLQTSEAMRYCLLDRRAILQHLTYHENSASSETWSSHACQWRSLMAGYQNMERDREHLGSCIRCSCFYLSLHVWALHERRSSSSVAALCKKAWQFWPTKVIIKATRCLHINVVTLQVFLWKLLHTYRMNQKESIGL